MNSGQPFYFSPQFRPPSQILPGFYEAGALDFLSLQQKIQQKNNHNLNHLEWGVHHLLARYKTLGWKILQAEISSAQFFLPGRSSLACSMVYLPLSFLKQQILDAHNSDMGREAALLAFYYRSSIQKNVELQSFAALLLQFTSSSPFLENLIPDFLRTLTAVQVPLLPWKQFFGAWKKEKKLWEQVVKTLQTVPWILPLAQIEELLQKKLIPLELAIDWLLNSRSPSALVRAQQLTQNVFLLPSRKALLQEKIGQFSPACPPFSTKKEWLAYFQHLANLDYTDSHPIYLPFASIPPAFKDEILEFCLVKIGEFRKPALQRYILGLFGEDGQEKYAHKLFHLGQKKRNSTLAGTLVLAALLIYQKQVIPRPQVWQWLWQWFTSSGFEYLPTNCVGDFLRQLDPPAKQKIIAWCLNPTQSRHCRPDTLLSILAGIDDAPTLIKVAQKKQLVFAPLDHRVLQAIFRAQNSISDLFKTTLSQLYCEALKEEGFLISLAALEKSDFSPPEIITQLINDFLTACIHQIDEPEKNPENWNSDWALTLIKFGDFTTINLLQQISRGYSGEGDSAAQTQRSLIKIEEIILIRQTNPCFRPPASVFNALF